MGDLPLKAALKEMTGAGDEDIKEAEEEMLEMLSVKLSEALQGDKGLREAIKRAHEESGGIPRKDELIQQIVRQIRHHFGTSSKLREAITGLIRFIKQPDNGEHVTKVATPLDLRKFHSYRLYDLRQSDRVQTGDIVELCVDGCQHAEGELAMILTPPCDLVRFLKKSAGCITFIRLKRFEEGKKICDSTKQQMKISKSITGGNPIILPVVPVESEMVDYVLFPREISSVTLSLNAGENNDMPLLYERVTADSRIKKFTFMARISEPFLSGILAKIPEAIIRAGIPDMPACEKLRLDGKMSNK
jgi:hypothetical protein